jgi:DNA polymerase III subunit alpha
MGRTGFVSLHTHSTYSYGDGHGQPSDFVKQASLLGHPAIALTEHGNVSSHVKLEQACAKLDPEMNPVRPIFGCELYTRDTKEQFKFHLTSLAMDANGYHGLLDTVSDSWRNFYFSPTTTTDMLRAHGSGLIILSGCTGSMIACHSLGRKGIEGQGLSGALRVAAEYKEIFGDRYYLELQAFPELDDVKQLNVWLLEVSKRLDIPVVATLDAHYPRPEQIKMHALIHAIARGGAAGKKTVDQQEASWDYNVPLTLFARQEVGQRLWGAGIQDRARVTQALDATLEIAERCDVTLPKNERVRYTLPQGVSSAVELMWQWLREGWTYRDMDHNLAPSTTREDYAQRLKHEVELMNEKDFVDYFLILSDAVRWAKSNGILVGPSRGSSGASLVCYLLRITEIDPLRHPHMYFERFIDPNRLDLPDVDLDFDDTLRDRVRRYLANKYGRDCVGNIGTFTRYRGKNSVDDIARVTRIPLADTARLKEFIIERSSADSRFELTLLDTVNQFPQAKEIWDKYPELENALELEGMLKGFGVHAAGLVVSNEPLTSTCAIYTRDVPSKIPGRPPRTLSVLSADKKDAEHLGILKIDFLGLTTLGMLASCLKMIGMSIDELYRLPLDDERVIDGFRRGDVRGIFQFEGRTTRMVTSQLLPDNFQELVDVNALSRPGPFHSGATLDYINTKHGKWNRDDPKNAWTFNEVIDRLCGFTKYQMLYQEQMLAICREIGAFSWIHISEIRRIISLKYGEAAFNAKRDMFVDGAIANGLDHDTALTIFKKMITSGQYAFVLAHSVAYATIAYWSMYMKLYHPAEFYTAELQKTPKDKWPPLMRDMLDVKYVQSRGEASDANWDPVRIGGLNIMRSGLTWSKSPNSNIIHPGFTQIPGIGVKLALEVIADREVAKDRSESWGWPDLGAVRGVGPKKMSMIQQWVNDQDPFGVETFHDQLEIVRGMLRRGELGDGFNMLPAPTHKAEELPYDLGVTFDGSQWDDANKMRVVWLGRVHDRNLRDMFEEHRSREGADLDPTSVKEPGLKHSMVLYAYDDSDEINVRVNRWKFQRLKDLLMRVRLDHDLILVQGFKNRSFGRKIEVENMWLIDPDDDE